MKKKIAKKDALKKKIVRWIEEAKKRLLLHAWTVSLVWTCDDEDAFMEVVSLLENREAEIHVNLKFCRTQNNNIVRQACYHEAAHILIWELGALARQRYVSQNQIRHAEEQLAQIIAKIVL